MRTKYNTKDLISVMEKLLGKNGCPWDKAQTHESLRQYFIEETYEAVEAIDNKDSENLKEELGDVLFQVIFHSMLAEKEGLFTFEDVTDAITSKMINRHPHVFNNEKTQNDEINLKWDSIKKAEKGYKTNMEIIKSVPRSLPALMRSVKTVSKAEKTGLDTPDIEKLTLENAKLSASLKSINFMNKEEKMTLIGNFLLNLSKISHFLQINAEFSLTNALETYINKLEDIEQANAAAGGTIEDTGSEDAKA